jgi:hypothetical protein
LKEATLSDPIVWTKESVEKEMRSQGRNCRGPAVLPADAQKAVQTAWQTILADPVWDAAVTFQRNLESAMGVQGGPVIPQDDWEMMNRHIRSLWDKRKGCGQDINDVILAGPLDGQIHEFNCPRCGIRSRYIPGVFEGVPSLV